MSKPTKIDSGFEQALQIALKELAKGERFTSEIREALASKGAADLSNEVVGHLVRRNLLNDKRAAEAVLNRQSGKRALGVEKLRETLVRRGAPPELIEEVLEGENSNAKERVLALLSKKFPQGASRAHAGRFLFSRGFSEESIESALDEWNA